MVNVIPILSVCPLKKETGVEEVGACEDIRKRIKVESLIYLVIYSTLQKF